MKYLKLYNESIEDTNLEKIEEVFYNISDKYYVNIKNEMILMSNTVRDIHYFTIRASDSPEDYIYQRVISISVSASKGYINPSPLDFESIKEDLEFAINYIEDKLNLTLVQIHVKRNMIPTNALYKKYNIFLQDNEYNSNDSMVNITLLFNDEKKLYMKK